MRGHSRRPGGRSHVCIRLGRASRIEVRSAMRRLRSSRRAQASDWAASGQVEQLGDVVEREPDLLRAFDEPHHPHGIGGVGPVAVCRSGRRRK